MSIIIGIDHGYYAIKTAHCSFPAGLTSYGEHEPYTRQGLLEFGGCFFVCGSGRQPIQRDKTINDNYYLLTLAAIAKEIRQRGLPPECSVRIAAGLPLTSFGRDKPKFKDYLLRNNQPVNFRFEGVEYSITIEEVAIFPQGYAALMTEVGLLQDEPSMLLMDLGGWTVDLMRIDNAIPAADTAHSLELGMIRCVDDIREQVKKLNAQIRACADTITKRRGEQQQLLRKQGTFEEEMRQKENSRSELSLLDKNNQMIELCKAYTQRIYDELNAEYKQKEALIRTKLQMYINEIFKSIYDGGLSLTIDEHYNISVYVTDFDGGVETSTAQSISVIFAFISAIIKMARENQIENGDEAYSEPYPLVMDAPLSAFDKRRIKAICSAIPETAEQVIIFIKDTDGELAEEHLGTKVMTRHYFEKIDEFHTHLV